MTLSEPTLKKGDPEGSLGKETEKKPKARKPSKAGRRWPLGLWVVSSVVIAFVLIVLYLMMTVEGVQVESAFWMWSRWMTRGRFGLVDMCLLVPVLVAIGCVVALWVRRTFYPKLHLRGEHGNLSVPIEGRPLVSNGDATFRAKNGLEVDVNLGRVWHGPMGDYYVLGEYSIVDRNGRILVEGPKMELTENNEAKRTIVEQADTITNLKLEISHLIKILEGISHEPQKPVE